MVQRKGINIESRAFSSELYFKPVDIVIFVFLT